MSKGQSHFHINSLHPEGKSSPSSWIKGLLYCIELPASLFSHCVLFFLTLWAWPKQRGPRKAAELDTAVIDRRDKALLDLQGVYGRAGRWFVGSGGDEGRCVKWKLTIPISCVLREIWIPLFYCQRRCPNLIKCLITFPRFSSHRWKMIESELLRLQWPWTSQNKPSRSKTDNCALLTAHKGKSSST